jgi:acyl-CoA dehydrogenase
MVNGSRFGVAMMGLGIARRAFLESAIWAHHREAKGRLLVDLPLVREQLVDLLVDLEAAIALGFECSVAGRWTGGDGVKLRRIVVPVAKNVLCRFGVEAAGFAVDLHGGNGYVEDWGLTRQLRDAVCHPIWEGSENICALDVLRAIRRDGAHTAALDRIDQALETAANSPGTDLARSARQRLASRIDAVTDDDAIAARLTWLLGRTLQAALLLEQAPDDPHKRLVAERFCRRHFDPESLWDDDLPQRLGRQLLAFAEV